MTLEKLQSLPSGTRLKGVDKYGGHTKGECGTLLHMDHHNRRAVIEWDLYENNRHTADGTVPNGHGWWVPYRFLEVAEELDLGDFSKHTEDTQLNYLFGGVL